MRTAIDRIIRARLDFAAPPSVAQKGDEKMRGNITKRSKGGWRIKFNVARDASGKRQTRYITVQGTKKEAEEKLASLLHDASRGVLVEQSKITVAEHMASWLDDKQGLSPLTRQRYGETIAPYINPTLGAIELQKLRPLDVKQWLVTMRQGRRGPRSARTILQASNILRESALRLDLGARNVADGTPIGPNYFSIMWSRAVTRTGLPKVAFHSLRHSHASALIRAKLDVMRVSKQLGHSHPAGRDRVSPINAGVSPICGSTPKSWHPFGTRLSATGSYQRG
jgi:integrase